MTKSDLVLVDSTYLLVKNDNNLNIQIKAVYFILSLKDILERNTSWVFVNESSNISGWAWL